MLLYYAAFISGVVLPESSNVLIPETSVIPIKQVNTKMIHSPAKQLVGSNKTPPKRTVLGFCFCLLSTSLAADDAGNSHLWQGEWMAEGTDFSLRVVPEGNQFQVEPVFPLGLNWKAGTGMISGNSGTINVEYEGVTAQVLVQLIDIDSAIVRSMSCQPDYHVICTLVRNQQARFIKNK
jgi:hypothetical protein